MVEDEYTSLGEAFHKDIGAYDGSLGRLARYEAILDRSLIRLMNEYRKIQADRRQREKRQAGDWARTGLPPLDPYADYDESLPEKLKNPEKIETIDAEENTENLYAEAHQSPAVSSRNPRNRRERRANPGGNEVNGTNARSRGPLPHPDGWKPAPGM